MVYTKDCNHATFRSKRLYDYKLYLPIYIAAYVLYYEMYVLRNLTRIALNAKINYGLNDMLSYYKVSYKHFKSDNNNKLIYAELNK